ncbi:DUF2510 domain-containing protein [Nocardia sp. CA-290969]|uniref:DUF2510 domain-containing protein n=1 Tax=Nocardia sp. CA-290969 TaxID=3239986 RepID=UPI003D8EE59D
MTAQDDNVARRRRTNRNILIIVGVIVGLLVVCGVVGAIVGDDQAAEEPAPTPTTTEVVAPPPALATPPAPASSSAPVPTTGTGPAAYSDPRCAPASADLVAQVATGLTRDGYTLTNGTVISEAGTTYFGATTLDASGRMENRSDVWVVRDGAVYASTGGARNETSFPKASDALGVSPGDPVVAAVDTCVIDLTR